MKKQWILILLVIVIFFSKTIISEASEIVDDQMDTSIPIDAIREAVGFVVADKDSYGLSEVSFNNLQVTSAIPAYEYKDGELNLLREYYPISDGSQIIALATNVCNDKYTLETELAKRIDKIGYDDVALIYDSLGVYAFNGKDAVLLGYSGIDSSYRDTIDLSSDFFSVYKIPTADISKCTSLEYNDNNNSLRTQNYYSCGVSYVPQAPYSNLCWAATVACIKKYLSGIYLTAGDVSMAYFDTNYVVNSTAYDSQVAGFMQSNYSMSYTYGSSKPSDSAILSNISNGYPIYGSFTWSNGRHAATIYGVNATSGYISVMDPEFGASSATYNGSTYTYVSSYSGVTLSLDRGICHSW